MAFGKEIGQFTLKLTSQTFLPCDVGRVSLQANLEGTASGDQGEGEVASTYYTEMDVGAKAGTFRQYGSWTLQDGTSLGFQIHGTWEEIGTGSWQYRGTGQLSDGSPYAVTFEGDWATKTWTGKAYQ